MQQTLYYLNSIIDEHCLKVHNMTKEKVKKVFQKPEGPAKNLYNRTIIEAETFRIETDDSDSRMDDDNEKANDSSQNLLRMLMN